MSPENEPGSRSPIHRKKSPALVPSDTAPPNVSSSAPTSFFLRSERDMQRQLRNDFVDESSGSKGPAPSGTSLRMADSSFGVQSLEDALGGAFPHDSESSNNELDSSVELIRSPAPGTSTLAGRKRKAGNPVHPKIAAAAQRIISSEYSSSRLSPTSSTFQMPSTSSLFPEHLSRTSRASSSRSFTLFRQSPQPDSAMPGSPRSTSPRSLRLSDEECSLLDDTGSQVLQSSSGEEEEEEGDALVEAGKVHTGTQPTAEGPQLVMPSIAMPSRRPFTDHGKSMGRLKVLVAGPTGVGKTALIRSILHTCKHIVHVDPSSLSASQVTILRGNASTQERTTQITELLASTRAYPAWWSDLEDSRAHRRRKSFGDVVLERNLCFVDTPGRTAETANEDFDSVVAYIQGCLKQNAALGSMSESELASLYSGGGGVQVDVVLYMFDASSSVNHAELEGLRRLDALTNVIPVLGHADKRSHDENQDMKRNIAKSLEGHGIKTFALQDSALPQASPIDSILPFSVSSALDDDMENMDASLLMSSEYRAPLASSDLPDLVNRLLDPTTMQWLRSSAVRKFLQWRREALASQALHEGAFLPLLGSPSTVPMLDTLQQSIMSSPSHVLVPYSSSAYYQATSPAMSEQSVDVSQGQAVARYMLPAGGSQDRYTNVRLAKWAEDLQRSLENERRQQQVMQGREQSGWPITIDKLPAEIDGNILALVPQRGGHGKTSKGGALMGGLDPRDPLGMLVFGQKFRRRGWKALRVLGGCGILGTVAVWTIRNWETVAELMGFSSPEVKIPGYGVVGPATGGPEGVLGDWMPDWDWKGLFFGGGRDGF